MEIIDLRPEDAGTIRQAAALLVEGFRELSPEAWPDLESAVAEVRASFGSGRVSLVALDEAGDVLGWVGGIRQYSGHVWDLHPLVVRAGCRRRGIGRALVAALEERVRAQGALTLWAGADDEANMTTLSGVNLYPDVLGCAREIRNLRGHPYEFYLKLGFVVVGVMPDANGPGKPDIYLAKHVGGAYR